MRKVNNILELIGQTPLVRINRLKPGSGAQVWAKLEFLNPGGSLKDRPALNMIEAAEKSGALTKDKIVLEATSGNTGIGLAMVCAVKGYRMVFTMSEGASLERRKILSAYGAEIILTPAHLSTDGAIEEAYRLARQNPDKYFLVDQYNNDDNYRAHYDHGTADEIYEAFGPQLKTVVAAMGTTGTLMGIARRMAELNPAVQVVGVEPMQGHHLQGLKNMQESYPPGLFDPRLVSRIVNIQDHTAFACARRLAKEEGIFAGMSAGAALAVALDEAAGMDDGVVVAILPDGGERYLTTELYDAGKTLVPPRLYNTLSRQQEEIKPLQPGLVRMYACGPSLDGPPDLGLCRRMVVADLVRRNLENHGYQVKLVVNLADIDDRTVNQCLKEGAQLSDFTQNWAEVFLADMAILNILPAHHYPKASEHINLMVDAARRLLEQGAAYEKLRSVYFDISRFPQYGKLSGVDLSAIQSDKQPDYDYYDKANPRDFTLFKRATLAELKAGIYWSTPWGNARPGWHVECAVMATRHLGQPFDLHLASTNLIFPHGDNEIAVAESLTGQPFAQAWLHSEVVMANGHKVSRTQGNDVTLRQLLEQGLHPRVIRYWLLSQHYHRTLTYSAEQMQLAAKAVERLDQFLYRLRTAQPRPEQAQGPAPDQGRSKPGWEQMITQTRQNWQTALDQDLNLPKALGDLFSFIRQANGLLSQEGITQSQKEQALELMAFTDQVLGLAASCPLLEQMEHSEFMDRLMAEREQARLAGDFARADELRAQLEQSGVRVADLPLRAGQRPAADQPPNK